MFHEYQISILVIFKGL